MMEELKKAHEGKRVDDGITFNTDKFVYTATDGTTYGLNHLQEFVCPYCFQVGELKATAFTYWKVFARIRMSVLLQTICQKKL